MVYDELYLVFLCLYYSLDNLQSATATKMDSMFQAFFTCTCLRVVSRIYSGGVFFFLASILFVYLKAGNQIECV